MKRERKGYRIEVYWEEFGTVKEGGMEDCRYHEVTRKPTKRDMTRLEKVLARELEIMGLLNDPPAKAKK